MKEKYMQKVAFLHGSQPWVCNAILQRNEVPATYQKMMKVAECMEDGSMHKKAGTPLILQLTTKGSATQVISGPKRSQKKKWDNNLPKDKGTPTKKKLWDVAKVQCFNYNELGNFAEDCEKVNRDWAQGGFVAKASVAKLGPNLIMFRFKVKINGVLCLLDSGAMHSFVNPSAVKQLGWVAKPIKVHLAQGVVTPPSEVVLGVVLECDKVKFIKNFIICALNDMEAI